MRRKNKKKIVKHSERERNFFLSASSSFPQLPYYTRPSAAAARRNFSQDSILYIVLFSLALSLFHLDNCSRALLLAW